MSDSEHEKYQSEDEDFEINSDEEYESDSEDEIDDVSTIIKEINTQGDAGKPIYTPLIISKYEYTKLIGVRSQMISMGSIPQVKRSDTINKTPTEIAINELNNKKMPLIIRRVVNKHIVEFCDPNQMELI